MAPHESAEVGTQGRSAALAGVIQTVIHSVPQ
jgi:hypothetical protein